MYFRCSCAENKKGMEVYTNIHLIYHHTPTTVAGNCIWNLTVQIKAAESAFCTPEAADWSTRVLLPAELPISLLFSVKQLCMTLCHTLIIIWRWMQDNFTVKTEFLTVAADWCSSPTTTLLPLCSSHTSAQDTQIPNTWAKRISKLGKHQTVWLISFREVWFKSKFDYKNGDQSPLSVSSMCSVLAAVWWPLSEGL